MRNFWKSCLVGVICVSVSLTDGKSNQKLPSFIHPCKKNDPKLDECMLKFFESFKSKFTTGVPEIGLPIMDPLVIEKINIKIPGNANNKMVATNLKIHGLKDMKLKEINVQLDVLKIQMKASFPFIQCEGMYNVDAEYMNNKIKGKGTFEGNVTDVFIDGMVEGKIIEKNGAKIMHFTNGDGKVNWKKYHIRIDNLFPDKTANQNFNNMINSPMGMSIAKSQLPIMKSIVVEFLMEYINKIVEHIPVDAIIH